MTYTQISASGRLLVAIGMSLHAFAAAAAGTSATPSRPAASANGPAPAGQATAGSGVSIRLRAPLFEKEFAATPVAMVDSDPIRVSDLLEALEASHGKRELTGGGAKDYGAMLERLIDLKLVIAEARDSGIDEDPEVKEKIVKIEQDRLKDILKQRAVRGVKVDEAQIARSYESQITEYRMHAVNFDRAEDARLLSSRMAKGTSFSAAVTKLVAEKKAKDFGEGSVVDKDLDPVFGPVVRRTKPGTITPATRIGKVWVVAEILEVKRKEDPQVRAKVVETLQAKAREEKLKQYYADLVKTNAQVDRKLLASLKYDAPKPGAAALAKDQRVLARLKDGKKVTVADLTAELNKHFWHGLEEAATKKRIGPKVADSFDSVLFRALLLEEAENEKLSENEEYRKAVREATDRVLFDAFMEKAIAPTIKVNDDEIRKYYEAHKSDYRTPGFVRLDGIAFASAKEAQGALDRLRAGTDLKWAKSNADGAIAPDKQKLRFEQMPVVLSSVPAGLASAISGAREGEYRLYAGDGEVYVVQLVKDFPPGFQTLEEAQKGIFERLFSDRIASAIKEWADKVRPHHQVQKYLLRAGE